MSDSLPNGTACKAVQLHLKNGTHEQIDAMTMTRPVPTPLIVLGLSLVFWFTGCSTSRVFEPSDNAPASPRDVSGVPDAVPRAEPRSRYGNPESYEVFGERYYTLPSSKGYRERGDASWYGTKFHGKRTSSGEPYDLYAMTAAHKTLPLPTYVEVTNLDNGNSVIVKVNDRGPFHEGRIIDLSYAAAARIGILGKGTGRVEVRAIDPLAPDQVPADSPVLVQQDSTEVKADSKLFLQVGAFQNRDNAERLRNDIRAQDLGDVRIVEADTERGTFYKVQVGPLTGTGEADRVAQALRPLGINTAQPYTE